MENIDENEQVPLLMAGRELERAHEYGELSTDILFDKRVMWRVQLAHKERSERSRADAKKILDLLELELASPARLEEVALLEALSSDDMDFNVELDSWNQAS